MRPSNDSARSSNPSSRIRRSFATLMTVIMLSTAGLPGAAAAEGSGGFINGFFAVWHGTVDVVLLRPMGIMRLAVGTTVLLPMSSFINFMGLPFGQDMRVFKEDWDRLVVEPAEYTFDREIGQDLAGF